MIVHGVQPPRMELRNGVLRGYVISYREYISATRLGKWLHQTVSSTADPGSKVLNYLRPATQYSVLIDAMTAAGRGPAFTAPLCSTLAEGTTRHLSSVGTSEGLKLIHV